MHELKLEFMPEATQKNFARLKDDPRLAGFTLVGGTALALQIGHRISEDLDFNIFGQKLPIRAIDALLDELAADGATIESLITSEQKLGFKINTSENLDDYIQDYLIDGAKVTFHSRNEGDRPKAQIDYLKSAPKVGVSKGGTVEFANLPAAGIEKSVMEKVLEVLRSGQMVHKWWEQVCSLNPKLTEPEAMVLFFKNTAGIWDQLATQAKQDIVRTLIKRITVDPEGLHVDWRFEAWGALIGLPPKNLAGYEQLEYDLRELEIA